MTHLQALRHHAMNREAWLTAAIEKLRPLFAELAATELPADVRVSCGFPKGNVRKVIGQCWSTKAGDGVPHVFVSPLLIDPVKVLEVLAATLAGLAAQLGDYPHKAITLDLAALPKQGTRMLKVECPVDGYTARTTAKWLEIGLPSCPCGEVMVAAEVAA